MVESEKRRAPVGACDCHMHIYDPAYPAVTATPTPGPDWATVTAYRDLQGRLGLDRAVVVQPTQAIWSIAMPQA